MRHRLGLAVTLLQILILRRGIHLVKNHESLPNSHRNHTNRIFYQKIFKSIDRFLRLTGRGGGGGGLSFFSLSIVTSY